MGRGFWLLGLVWLSACGGAAGGEDAGARDAGSDAHVDPGEDVPVRVESSRGGALAGVTVTFDGPDGERGTCTTDASGTCVLEGIHWGDGRATLSVTHPEHEGLSAVDYTRAELESRASDSASITLLMIPRMVSLARVSVSLTQLPDTGGAEPWYLVSSSRPGTRYSGPETAGQLELVPGAPFVLSAVSFLERRLDRYTYDNTFFGVARVVLPSLDADREVEIDFERDAATFERATFVVPLPPEGHSLHDALFRAYVFGEGSEEVLGLLERATYDGETGELDLTLAYMRPDDVTAPRTALNMSTSAGLFSSINVPGWPTPGPMAVEWLEPPHVLNAELWEPVPMDRELEISAVPAGNELVAVIAVEREGRREPVWRVLVRGEAGRLRIPSPLPVGLEPLLGDGVLTATLYQCEPSSGSTLCSATAGGERWEIAR